MRYILLNFITFFTILLFANQKLFGQTKINELQTDLSRETIFLELGGPGIGLSANYNYRYTPKISFNLGASYFLFGYGFPVGVSYITNPFSSHHFEAGIGVMIGKISEFNLFGYTTKPVFFIWPDALIGYRYQKTTGGFFFRAILASFIVPIEKEKVNMEDPRDVKNYTDIGFTVVPGISIGWCIR
jgi:hypothetical protein